MLDIYIYLVLEVGRLVRYNYAGATPSKETYVN
jgi:hypothetical protein